MLLFEVTGHLKEGERGGWEQEKIQTRFFMTQQLWCHTLVTSL